MLDRNIGIKAMPERFQDDKVHCMPEKPLTKPQEHEFDVLLTCESRVFDQVVQGEPMYATISHMVRP